MLKLGREVATDLRPPNKPALGCHVLDAPRAYSICGSGMTIHFLQCIWAVLTVFFGLTSLRVLNKPTRCLSVGGGCGSVAAGRTSDGLG